MRNDQVKKTGDGLLANVRYRRKWKRLTSVLSIFVVIGTVSSLMLPAVTMNQYICGKEEHAHGADCYTAISQQTLSCSYESLGIHRHSRECYDAEENLLCELADFAVHTHDSSCFDANGLLVCPLAEVKEHQHDDSCCEIPEIVVDEGHAHVDQCYEQIASETPTCGAEESSGHHHGEGCYATGTELLCTIPESQGHSHLEECFGEDGEILCGQEEGSGHTHEAGCFAEAGTLLCATPESDGHQHTEECFGLVRGKLVCTEEEREPVIEQGEPELICEIEEVILHTHKGTCFEYDAQGNAVSLLCEEQEVKEHQHGEGCFTQQEVTTLTCTLAEHTHTDECREEEPTEPSEDAGPGDETDPTGETGDDAAADPTGETDPSATTEPTGETGADEATGPSDGASEETQPPLTEEELLQVADVILMVDGLPDREIIDSEFARLLGEGDQDSYLAYREKIVNAVQATFDEFFALSAQQQEAVTNVDRLMSYRYILDLPIVGQSFTSSSADGSISVEAVVDGAMPEGTSFVVESVLLDEEAQDQISTYLQSRDSELLDLQLLEMHFTGPDGLPRQPTGETDVTLRFAEPILPGEGDIFVFHIIPEGAVNVTRAVKRNENGVSQVTIRTDGFSTYGIALASVSSSVTVATINHDCWNDGAVMLFHKTGGVKISDWSKSSFAWNNAIVVEPINGVLTVTKTYGADGSSKANVSAASGGFILVSENSFPASVGDTVTTTPATFWKIDNKQTTPGNYGTITFTSAAENYPRPDKNNNVPTVPSADTSKIINVNLWNYSSNINDKWRNDPNYPGFQYPGGAQTGGLSRWNMAYGDNIVSDTSDNTWINVTGAGAPGGAINGNGKDFIEGAVSSNLGADGYPVLAYNNSSLSWLFSPNTYAAKQNSDNINGLFRYNPANGEYFYDSRINHAQYANNKFTLYDAWITSNFVMYPFGNFLPFNNINTQTTHAPEADRAWFLDIAAYAQYEYNNTGDQRFSTLAVAVRDAVDDMDATYPSGWGAEEMVREYFKQEGLTNSDKPVGVLPNIYSIDYSIPTDFFFGMDMNMTFMQPKNGVTGPNNDYDMIFRFVGDDDVWVFIDDVLFLDLTGIHRHKGGTIDFVNGVISYYDLDPATGDISTTATKSYTFAQMLERAGKDASVLNEKGTFKDYTTHTFKFYFMERGSGSSVCKMNFNFPLLRQNSITVQKELTVDEPDKLELLGNPDFLFQVWKENGTELFIAPNTPYEIVDANDNFVANGTTDENGIFRIKAGQKAIFEGIEENAGRYFIRELLNPTDFEQYGKIEVNGSSETTGTGTDVMVGSDSFKGVDSPIKDMSDGSTVFHFKNELTFNKLGHLHISKEVERYVPTRAAEQFEFYVTMDGEPLPIGTTYAVGTESRTVETEGIIVLAKDETAVLSGIVSSTEFTVQETSGSAHDYDVTYGPADVNSTVHVGTNENGPYAYGVILNEATVKILVTNKQRGTEIDIPVTKSVINPDGQARDYTFTLKQSNDPSGSSLVEGTEQTVTLSVNDLLTKTDAFHLFYVEEDLEVGDNVFYYLISEQAGTDTAVAYDTAKFIVEVTVTKSAEKAPLTAEITKIRKHGSGENAEKAEFKNTLLTSLTVGKLIDGGVPTTGTFTFEITLHHDTLTIGTLTGVRKNADGTKTAEKVTSDKDGIYRIQLKHGETFKIQGIPAGSTYTVTESSHPGYSVSHRTDSGEGVSGDSTSGSLTMAGSTVIITNTGYYELPNTGSTGTTPYIFSGLALMVGAGCLMYSNKRKNRKGAK